ncbi:MAG: hypothetical protein GY856_13340, partial [bacterium]|nr:hypothetical protein [bacterium]
MNDHRQAITKLGLSVLCLVFWTCSAATTGTQPRQSGVRIVEVAAADPPTAVDQEPPEAVAAGEVAAQLRGEATNDLLDGTEEETLSTREALERAVAWAAEGMRLYDEGEHA